MKALKQNVLDVLQNYDRPKFEILLKGCFKLLCGGRRQTASSSTGHIIDSDDEIERGIPNPVIIDDNDDEPLISSRHRVPSYTEMREPSSTTTTTINGGETVVKLRCPGRIMHILPMAAGDRQPNSSRFINCNHLSDVLMSSSMISDHMPWTMSKILKDLSFQL